MAAINSAVMAALASSIQRKSAYRGNVQAISIYTDNGTSLINDADVITFTDVLPPNTKVLGVHVKSAGVASSSTLTFKVGTTAVTAALAVGSAIDAFYAFTEAGVDGVDGSGKQVTGLVDGADWDDGANDLFGFLLIVTDE